MGIRSWLRPVLVLALCLGGALLPAGPGEAASADTQGPQVLDIQITPLAASLTGMTSQVVTIKVHLTDQTGVCSDCALPYGINDRSGTPFVILTPHLSQLPEPETDLTGMRLVSGTVQDGWWATTRPVTGAWAGTFEVIRVVAVDTANPQNMTDLDPRGTPLARQLQVTAVDPPHLSAGYSPPVLPPGQFNYAIKGRAYLSTSGQPVVDQPVWYCAENGCGFDFFAPATPAVRTNTGGYYPAFTGLYLVDHQVFLGPGGPIETSPIYAMGAPSPWFGPPLTVHLDAALATTPVPLGTAVAVTGHSTVLPATDPFGSPPYPSVWLQRLVSGVWVTQSSAPVRASGRFTLIAVPPTRGNHRYRVVRPGTFFWLQAVTPTMLLGVY